MIDAPALPELPGVPGAPGSPGGPGAPPVPPLPHGVSNILSCMLSISPCKLLRTEGIAELTGAGICVCVTVVPHATPAHGAAIGVATDE